MIRYVLDASALLALINEEPGSEIVLKALSGALMSSVNIAEVWSTLVRLKIPSEAIEPLIGSLVHTIVPFDTEQAYIAGSLYEKTRSKGLSLGDRSCLALAKAKDCPVLTADRMWAHINCGVTITLVR